MSSYTLHGQVLHVLFCQSCVLLKYMDACRWKLDEAAAQIAAPAGMDAAAALQAQKTEAAVK